MKTQRSDSDQNSTVDNTKVSNKFDSQSSSILSFGYHIPYFAMEHNTNPIKSVRNLPQSVSGSLCTQVVKDGGHRTLGGGPTVAVIGTYGEGNRVPGWWVLPTF